MDKVVVITGASSGIGAALADELGRRGAKLVLAARRNAELSRVAQAAGPSTLAVVADVTRRSEVQRIVDEALGRFERIDVWVNNAGRGITRSVVELTDEDFDAMFTVNTKSALYGMQAVLPHMKQRGRGHIINVSSMLGRLPIAPYRSAYSAAKAALLSLTAHLRVELRATHPNIIVSSVLPGVVATDFGNRALHGGPDSRTLPFAQPADEVAKQMVQLIETPHAELYTRPNLRGQVAAYYSAENVVDVESKPPISR